MIKILFICHGNICRSPMAEFILKHITAQLHQSPNFIISSAATSTEEIGNPVHRGTRQILQRLGISADGKYAVQFKKSDYEQYDYIIGMDSMNIKNIKRISGCNDQDKKVYRLLEFAGEYRDVADPWYTGDFEATCRDVVKGCIGLLEHLGIDCEGIKDMI
ncbi:MAG: low molecular weight phosphotyrosine protein phosphatase [Lachnospiraceae bacterium]|nr:low molecular weight phosphotyrosine protein phosphatase [Lachnospiraceae bacterium]